MAYSAKHEQVEALKASFRGNKEIGKDEQKVKLKELQDKMDTMRKQGVKKIKAKLSTLMENEDMSLSQKVAALVETGQLSNQIKQMMKQCCAQE